MNQLYDMELAERFHLKRKLECKTFEWYLTYIYPELEIPKAKTTDRCMSAVINHLKREESVAHAPLCDHEDFNQILFYKKTKEIIVRDPSDNEWIMSSKGNRIVVSHHLAAKI